MSRFLEVFDLPRRALEREKAAGACGEGNLLELKDVSRRS
jgi:hypothetical protein